MDTLGDGEVGQSAECAKAAARAVLGALERRARSVRLTVSGYFLVRRVEA